MCVCVFLLLVFLILHFVFPHFSRLTVRIEHFRLENRIPGAQLYHFPAGMVWNHEVESKLRNLRKPEEKQGKPTKHKEKQHTSIQKSLSGTLSVWALSVWTLCVWTLSVWTCLSRPCQSFCFLINFL